MPINYDKIVWLDEYCIGVEIVDKAHKELFHIVNKLLELSRGETNSRKREIACAEGIKFFKNYVVVHFQQEEEYMRSIKYSGYLAHKRRHDLMKNETVPALEKELIKEEYSREAVEHFTDICTGWLMTHIVIEDGAIVKNREIHWEFEKDKAVPSMERLFDETLKLLFNSSAKLLDQNYDGTPLDRAICMRYFFKNPSGKRVQIIFEVEERVITSSIAKMLHVPLVRINDISLTAMDQMMLSVIQRVAPLAKLMDQSFQFQTEQRILAAEVKTALAEDYFKYKLLFDSDDGTFAFCFTNMIEENHE